MVNVPSVPLSPRKVPHTIDLSQLTRSAHAPKHGLNRVSSIYLLNARRKVGTERVIGPGVVGAIAIFVQHIGRLLNARLIGAAKGVSLPHIGAARVVVLQVKTGITLGGVTTNRVVDSRTSLGQYTGTTVLVKGVAFNYVSGSVE